MFITDTRTRVALATLVTCFTMASSASALAARPHTYSSTLQSLPVSTANGYPAPGGTAVLVGALSTNPFGQGALVDRVKITAQPAANKFFFTGTEIDYVGSGTVRSTINGLATVLPDGSQTLAVRGRVTGGTGSYARVVGGYTFAGAVAAGSTALSGHSTGTLNY